MATMLGRKVRDRVTGFTGIITGHCEYLSGCNQSLVVPGVDDKGAFREPQWLDDQRLEIVDDTVIKLDNGLTPGCDRPAPVR